MQRCKGGYLGLGGGLLSLEATGILTQDDDPLGTTPVDARNGSTS